MAERTIYVASRASVPSYPQTWKALRAQGWPINSTWIDEAGPGETADWGERWQRIESEVRAACGVVLWAEVEDLPLKGAYVEVGMCLGMGKPVAVVTKHTFEDRNYRPFGSWMNHPLVERCHSLQSAMLSVLRRSAAGVAPSQTPSGPLEQVVAGMEALDDGHDSLCMAVLRGKACTCGVSGTFNDQPKGGA